MIRIRHIAAALAALLLVPAAPALAQPQKLPVTMGDWSPPDTGVVFPETIGMYERDTVYEFGPENWGVNYVLYWGGQKVNVVSIYLYPHPEGASCFSLFTASKESLLKNHGDADPVGDTTRAATPRGTGGKDAWTQRYSYDTNVGGTKMAVYSDTYLYCHPTSGRLIKLRATAPAAANRIDEAMTVLKGVTWPVSLSE